MRRIFMRSIGPRFLTLLLLIGCGVGCGYMNAACELSVNDALGKPMPGAIVVWEDWSDADAWWSGPTTHPLCVTAADGRCAGRASYQFSHLYGPWGNSTGDYRIRVTATNGRSTVVVVSGVTRKQAQGIEALTIGVQFGLRAATQLSRSSRRQPRPRGVPSAVISRVRLADVVPFSVETRGTAPSGHYAIFFS